MSTVNAQVYGREGLQAPVAGQIAISPRLLNLDAAAAYLSVAMDHSGPGSQGRTPAGPSASAQG
jgi:hypothetical protein